MNDQTEVSIVFKNKITNQEKLEKYAESLKKVNSFLTSIDTGKAKAVEQVAKNTNNFASKETNNNVKELRNNLNSAFNIKSMSSFIKSFQNMTKQISSYTKKSAEFLENWNLLDVAFQNNTTEAEKFVNTLTEMYGLDESWGYRTVGIFKQLSNAMGLTDEVGTKLSKTLTQLAIDTSSLYNIDIEDTVSILQSGLAGQTKPVRRLGGDITQTTLQLTLDAYGIDETVNQLSYAEKRLVIVTSLLDQTEKSFGDWGRTITSVANQMRIFQQQVERLTRAIGNVFLPILKAILPYMNAIIMVLTEIISWFALLIGYDPEEFDFFSATNDSVIDLKENLDGAGASAKKLQSGLRSFDKLNVIKTPSTTGGGVGGGLNGVDPKILEMFNKASDDYLNNLSNVKMKATEIRDAIMQWLGFTKLVDAKTGDVSFKLKDGYSNLKMIAVVLTTISGLKIFKGLGLGKLLTSLISKLINTKTAVLAFSKGTTSLSTTLSAIFPSLGKLIGGIGGSGGLSSILGALAGPVGIAIAVVTALATAFIHLYKTSDEFKAKVDGLISVISETLTPIFSDLKNFLIDAIEKIKEALSYLWKNVLQPIAKMVLDILEPAFSFLIDTLTALWKNVIDPLIPIIKDIFGGALSVIVWIIKEGVVPILESFMEKLKALSPIIDLIKIALDIFGQIVKKVFEEVGEKINIVKAGFEGLKIAWEKVKNWFKENFKLPELKVPKLPKIKLDVEYDTNVGKATKTIYEALGLKGWPKLKFKTYAQGGLPPVGQLFVANERGPELIGQIGGQSFVANQNQVLDLLDKKLNSNNNNNKKIINIYLDEGHMIASYTLDELESMARSNGEPITIGA